MSGGPIGNDEGHPLPASGEARHGEIPEELKREKGEGDDAETVATPNPHAVNPDGTPYAYGDLGRGPGAEEPPRTA